MKPQACVWAWIAAVFGLVAVTCPWRPAHVQTSAAAEVAQLAADVETAAARVNADLLRTRDAAHEVHSAHEGVKALAARAAESIVRSITAPCPGAGELVPVAAVGDPAGAPSPRDFPYVAVHRDHAAFYLKYAPAPDQSCQSFYVSEHARKIDGSPIGYAAEVRCGVDGMVVGHALPVLRRRPGA